MPFKDYSTTPASNTEIGDGLFIGPNMSRNDVRPSLQQLAADGRDLYDEVIARGNGATPPAFIQSGAGMTERTLQAKGRDVLNLADRLPSGYVTDGSVDYTTQIQAAIDEAIASGRRLIVPGGVFTVSGTGVAASLSGEQQITIEGQGNGNTRIRNANGNVMRLAGQFIRLIDLELHSEAGGHTVLQTGLVAQSAFIGVTLTQSASGYSIWENASHEFVENRFFDCLFNHVTTATVHPFNLVAAGGLLNNNEWKMCRAFNSGTKHFFNVEATTANAQYANKWDQINFEVCLGGGIRMRAANRFSVVNCHNWDAGAGGVVNDFYDLGATLGVGVVGTFKDCGRWAGTPASGKYDLKLPAGGAAAGVIVENCGAVSGQPFTIDAQNNAIVVIGIAQLTAVTNAAGLTMIDPLVGLSIGGLQVVGPRKTGWAVDTGTAKRTANATYTPGAALTFSGTYTQAEHAATATRLAAVEAALRDATQTIKALKDDLYGTGATPGLIGA